MWDDVRVCSLPYQSHDLHVREVTPHVTRPPVLIEGATQSAAIGWDDVADAIDALEGQLCAISNY